MSQRRPAAHRATVGLHAWTGPDFGWGVIGEVDGDQVRVDFFESAANPFAESHWLARDKIAIATLPRQTRVLWEDGGRWQAGRVLGGDAASGYAVRKPNVPYDLRVPARQLRVRWSRSVMDPLQVLLTGANESPYFAETRLPFIREAVAQRAACSSAPAILSSAVELYPHQLRAVLQVLRDPIQRYLLADEVGLGKTIEAGMVARQVLLDRPNAAVTFIVPDVLRRQWQGELREKFFIDDFPAAQIRIVAHEAPLRWQDTSTPDLVVVDEAHHLVAAGTPAYVAARLADVCHASPRLLLLSATPALHHERQMLGMLHLLDPELYRLDDLDGFSARVRARHEIASTFYALDPTFPELVPLHLATIRAAFPDDRRLGSLTDAATNAAQADAEALPASIEQLRAYVNETYRLHRRVIRHRRDRVLETPGCGPDSPTFEVCGRQEPERVEVDDHHGDAAEQLLEQWRQAVRDHLVETSADPQTWMAYAWAHAVLTERCRDHAGVLRATIAYRLGEDDRSDTAGLDRREARLLKACPLLRADRELRQGLAELPGPAETHSAIARLVRQVCRRHRRLLVFTGTTALGRAVVDALRAYQLSGAVVRHLAGEDPAQVDQALRAWLDGRARVLVCDRSGEEGRNLQVADAVVHLHLPWSVNRLEQRLGRVDRHGDSKPAAQYVLSPSAEDSVVGEWLNLLGEGFGVFRGSLSVLQYAIDEVTPEVFLPLLRRGGQGLLEVADMVATTLQRRRKDIAAEDSLDAAFTGEYDHNALFRRIDQVESGWRNLERVVDNLVYDANGSLQLARKKEVKDAGIRRYVPGRHALLPVHLLAQALPGSWDTPGCFNRTAALRRPGHRVLRLGAPFVDTLWRWVQQDDLGQATAWWRPTRAVEGEHAYLGFEYLVDADICLVRNRFPRLSAAALQRRLDGWFMPFTERIWLDPWSTDLAEPAIQRLLDGAYDPRRGDDNLNAGRFPVLLDLFGGAQAFRDVVGRAGAAAPSRLRALRQLEEQAAGAEKAADRDLRREEEQRQARAQAGAHLASEADTVALGLREVLRAACQAPRLRLVAVSCVVLSDQPFARAAEEYGADTR